MKRLKLLLAVFALTVTIAFLVGCSQPGSTAYVRFQNNITSNGQPWNLGYGVRAGTAEYDGSLGYGSATPYYPIVPGTYSLQMKTSGGSWDTITTSVTVTETRGHWTVVMAGDWSTTLTFTIIEDTSS